MKRIDDQQSTLRKTVQTSPLVIVTGAARGIGEAIALQFAKEGYRVAALDLNEKNLQRLKKLKYGAQIVSYVCDLNNLELLAELARSIRKDLGPPTVIVNNAGIHIYANVQEATDEIWSKSLNVNLLSAVGLIREFVSGMKRIKGASIINISSRNALSSSPRSVTYDSTKAALLALTRSLAMDLGGDGIRVNAVLPGMIETPAHKDLLKKKTFRRNCHRMIPLNRFGTAEEIASVVFFLASEQAGFITGQGIIVDGGQICGQNYGRIFGRS